MTAQWDLEPIHFLKGLHGKPLHLPSICWPISSQTGMHVFISLEAALRSMSHPPPPNECVHASHMHIDFTGTLNDKIPTPSSTDLGPEPMNDVLIAVRSFACRGSFRHAPTHALTAMYAKQKVMQKRRRGREEEEAGLHRGRWCRMDNHTF